MKFIRSNMKITTYIKAIASKLCGVTYGQKDHRSSITTSSEAPTLPPVVVHGESEPGSDTRSVIASTAMTPSIFTDITSPSRMLSQRSAAPSFGTTHLNNAALAPANDELMLDNSNTSNIAQPSLTPISEEKPTASKHADELEALKAEVNMLELVNQSKEDQIQKLSHELEREHNINFELQQSKFARPQKLKKQVKRLSAQLHAKETETEEWRRKFTKLAWTAGLRDDIAGTRDLLEKSVLELEKQAQDWRKRMEDVAKMARQIERKERGLGMWWTREEFDELTAKFD